MLGGIVLELNCINDFGLVTGHLVLTTNAYTIYFLTLRNVLININLCSLCRVQTQPEAQSSPQAAGVSARPARTLPIAPPPSTGKRPAPGPASQSSSAVSAQPADAPTFDLLSGDPEYNLLSEPAPTRQPGASSSSMALTVIDPPPQRTAQDDLLALTVIDQPQRMQEDLLASPAPDAHHLNPFESSPFQATPQTDAMSPPVYSSQSSFQQRAGTSVPRPENSWSAAPRPPSSFYGETQTQPTVPGQAMQSQPQFSYPQPQPVVTTPPPWQEDTEAVQAPLAGQQWQGASQGYGYGGNTSQMYYSGQQFGMGGMQPGMGPLQQQYLGSGYAGFSSQSSLPSFQSAQYQQAPYELPRFESVGTGPGGNFGNQYLNQRGIYGQSSGLGTSEHYGGSSNQNLKSPDTLFHDLVDLRSVNAQFKAASLANKQNTTKAGS